MQSTLAFPICKLLQIKYKHSNLIYISSDSVSFKIKQTVESYNIYNFCTIYIYIRFRQNQVTLLLKKQVRPSSIELYFAYTVVHLKIRLGFKRF